jgi:outer membrane protein
MTNVLRNTKVWTLALALTVATGVGAAQQAGPATAQALQVDRYVVGQAKPPADPNSPIKDLTLEDAIQTALENNLDLKVARMNPQSVDYQLQSARAVFLPRLTSSYSYSNASSVSTNTLDGVARTTTLGQNYNGGMSQSLPWYGGSFTLSFNNSRSSTNVKTARLNPNYNSSVRFNYTQPLLTNRSVDNNRNQLKTLQIQRQISDIQLLTTIENTKASVRTMYWALRASIEQIEIQKRSLELAQRLFEDNKIKVEIGTMAPIETTTSETAVANAEQALLNAQIQWRTAELNLKRLLVSGPDDDLYKSTINPVDQPVYAVQSVDIQAAVQNALANRTDMTQTRRNIEVSQLNLQVTKNSTMPQLDLSGGYTLTGNGGTLFQGGVAVNQGGYLDALRAIAGLDTPTWTMSLNFSYPLGMAAAKANYARAQLSLDQQQAQLKAQELTLATDVTNAGLAVENTYKQLQAAQKAREAAERNAAAEETRFQVGMSTNYNVVQAQNNLTSTRLSELSRMIAYINAIAEFDRIQRVGR